MLSSTITNRKNMNTVTTQRQQDILLEKFLAKFPDDATSWAQATDEIRDMARTAKEYYNEIDLDLSNDDSEAYPALDFTLMKKPSQWNTLGKKYIRAVVFMMKPTTRKQFFDRFAEWLQA